VQLPKILLASLAMAMVLPAIGCVERVVETRTAPAQIVYVPQAPPAPVAEAVPPAPGPAEAYIWKAGFYRWNGREYAWVHGAWEPRPARGGDWVAAHWEQRSEGWVFVEGFYR
jgi:hypothetical protein